MSTNLVGLAYQARGPIHRFLAQRGITRAAHGKLLGGVCAGLAGRLPVSAWVLRAVFGVLLLFPVSSLLLYAALWLILPPAVKAKDGNWASLEGN
ncbi:PspC domain-containing protein [Amycolatopsis sp. H20-H5]|uniref:PspC domain-containing protein n=1 Tax=Amycolatopsis sp. H20-H5 TaxID=3046309 RepID=UPI002DBF8B78|nr:PspC domain-containing protein [Amycolatopsis sp. H20-H5]MEC3981306.1 PspC domain-containing protein [Amycolatopsis sp. H20-H5]